MRIRKIIQAFNNMNVLCMHGINDGINHLSAKNPNIKISDVIEKAEKNMNGHKIDVLAVCNKNSGDYFFYNKNLHPRISAENSNVGVSLSKDNETGLIEIGLSLEDESGEFVNISNMKQEKLMQSTTFEEK